MDISDVGVEALIHWNSPPLAWALGQTSLVRQVLTECLERAGNFVFLLNTTVFCLVQVELHHPGEQVGLHGDKKAEAGGSKAAVLLLVSPTMETYLFDIFCM